jgi:hypothetical protein
MSGAYQPKNEVRLLHNGQPTIAQAEIDFARAAIFAEGSALPRCLEMLPKGALSEGPVKLLVQSLVSLSRADVDQALSQEDFGCLVPYGVPLSFIRYLLDELPQYGISAAAKNLCGLRFVACQKRGDIQGITLYAQVIAALDKPLVAVKDRNPFSTLAELDLDGNLSPDYLIDNTLEEDSLAVVFGPSGSGKSFFVLDLGLSVATGVPWNKQPVKQGVVVHLCGEGHGGNKRRVKAWLQHNRHTAPETFILSRYAVAFDDEAHATITAAAREVSDQTGFPVRLFIVDTLDRHIDGDENKTPDMSRFIKIADSLKATFPGSSVVIVHHTGKADQQTGRGASNLKAAADVEVRCMGYRLDWQKVKDAAMPEPLPFKLVPVTLGYTDEGEPITSCVPEYGSLPARLQQSDERAGVDLTRFEQQALDALIAACAAENRPRYGNQYQATVEAWRVEFYRLRLIEEPDETSNALKTQFRRVRFGTDKGGGLVEKQVVFIDGSNAVLMRLPDNETVKKTAGTPVHVPVHGNHVPAAVGGT